MNRLWLLLALMIPFCLIAAPAHAAAPLAASEGLSSFFNDPNIAYLFLALAILGILIEIITPGMYFPGTVGVLAAILAFYALGLLPVNPWGLVLLLLALPLFVLGAYLSTVFIPFTVVGVAALLVGSIYLFHAGFEVHPGLIAAVVVIMSAVFILVSNRVVKSQRRRVATGREDLIGRAATVRSALTPSGMVLIEGELWQAELDHGHAKAGEEATVTAVNGLKLMVTKK
jgi:membrane-bound serine protease (ClpP class)